MAERLAHMCGPSGAGVDHLPGSRRGARMLFPWIAEEETCQSAIVSNLVR